MKSANPVRDGNENAAIACDVPTPAFARHAQRSALLPAAAEDVFAFLDTHENIASHMNKPSDINPAGAASNVVVSIDYDLPRTAPGNWLGPMFGHVYARWCANQIVESATNRFGRVQPDVGRLPG